MPALHVATPPLALALLLALPAMASGQTAPEIIAMREEYRSAADFLKRGDAAAAENSADRACTMYRSAENMFRGVRQDAGRFSRIVNRVPGVTESMRGIEADATGAERAAGTARARWCDGIVATANAVASSGASTPRTPSQLREEELRAAYLARPIDYNAVTSKRFKEVYRSQDTLTFPRAELPGTPGLSAQLPPDFESLGVTQLRKVDEPRLTFRSKDLTCSIWITPRAARAADGAPESMRGFVQLAHRWGATPDVDVWNVDGARVLQELGQGSDSMWIWSVRSAPLRPAVTTECQLYRESSILVARALVFSLRWTGEPDSTLRGSFVKSLSNTRPHTDAQEHYPRVTLSGADLLLYSGRASLELEQPTLFATGLSAELPSDDWGILAERSQISFRPGGNAYCHAVESGPWTEASATGPQKGDSAQRLGGYPYTRSADPSDTLVIVRDGNAIVRRYATIEYETVLIRYVPGKPALLVQCDSDYDSDLPRIRETLRALAHSVRWADER